jgi:alcohol dehydrogenase class IV
MSANLRALRRDASATGSIQRYTDVARWLTANENASPDDGVRWVADLVNELRIARLGSYGIAKEHAADLTAAAARSSSMKANPILLEPAELTDILLSAL